MISSEVDSEIARLSQYQFIEFSVKPSLFLRLLGLLRDSGLFNQLNTLLSQYLDLLVCLHNQPQFSEAILRHSPKQ